MNYSKSDVTKRNLYNKMENIVKNIKLKINANNSDEDKKKLLKKIALIVIAFQVDSIYEKVTDVSGLACLLEMFGIPESYAEKIKNLGYGSVSALTVSMVILRYLSEVQQQQKK